MDKRLIVVLALIIFVLVSGQQCKKEEKISFNTTALTMAFVPDAPPSQLVPGEKYKIYVDIVNNGGFDIAPGDAHFYLSGIGDNLKNVNLYVANAQFLNKKTALQEGGKERLIFGSEVMAKELPSAFDFTVRLDACYKYATLVQTKICIGRGDGICSVSGEKIKTGDNSAAPVQVTSLTQSIQGNKLYVKFTIENKGKGEVYLPNLDCTKLQMGDIDEKLKQNQVELAVNTEEGFSCILQGGRKALSGAAEVRTISCEKILTTTESHEAPFQILLTYIYRESLTKPLTILPA